MKALIVIDCQVDFLTGVLGSNEAARIIPNVKNKIEEYIQSGDEIFYTQDTHLEETYANTQEGQNLPILHCVQDTEGWEIHEELEHTEFPHLMKQTFGYPHWAKMLDSFTEIEIVGVCTDICVISNALIIKALYPETPITVDASCCAGLTSEKHNAALTTMESCQIKVIRKEKDNDN